MQNCWIGLLCINSQYFWKWTNANPMKIFSRATTAYLYYKVRCVSVCGHSNVWLTTPPVLMLWGTQGYLWLPYDLTEVINLIGERLEPKKYFFQKNTLCHSFCISVIPSVLLSFFPYYCHSFRIIVIPSVLVSFLPNIVIPSELFWRITDTN